MQIPDSPNFSLGDVLTVLGIGTMSLEDQTDTGSFPTGLTGFDYEGFYISDDGIELRLLKFNGDVHHFTFGTPLDVSTLSTGPIVAGPLPTCRGISFNEDGTIGFLSEEAVYVVSSFTLSTPYDFSTSTPLATITITGIPVIGSFVFKRDGTKFWLVEFSAELIKEYTLTTPWDLNTATLVDTNIGLGVSNLIWVNDGRELWARDNELFVSYLASTPYDATTLSIPGVEGEPFSFYSPKSLADANAVSSVIFFEDTGGFNFVSSSYGVPGGTSLSGAFAGADPDSFDPTHSENKDRLSNFRNYIPIPPITCTDLSNFAWNGDNSQFDGTSESLHGWNWSEDGLHGAFSREEGGLGIKTMSVPFGVDEGQYTSYYYGGYETSCFMRNLWVNRSGSQYASIVECNDGHALRGANWHIPWEPQNGQTARPGTSPGFFPLITGLTVMDESDSGPQAGSKLWTCDWSGQQITQYDMNFNWDYSDANLTLEGSAPVGSNPGDLAWNEDGSILYVLLPELNVITEFFCDPPFDITGTFTEGASATMVEGGYMRGMDKQYKRAAFTTVERDKDQWAYSWDAPCD